MKKKEYIRPMITIFDVDIKNCLLGMSTISIDSNNGACESWTQNMQGVLKDLDSDLHGGFHNTFEVDDSWGDDAGAL